MSGGLQGAEMVEAVEAVVKSVLQPNELHANVFALNGTKWDPFIANNSEIADVSVVGVTVFINLQ